MSFHAFDKPTPTYVERWGETEEGEPTMVQHGRTTLLGFFWEPANDDRIHLVYVDHQGRRFPTWKGYRMTFLPWEESLA